MQSEAGQIHQSSPTAAGSHLTAMLPNSREQSVVRGGDRCGLLRLRAAAWAETGGYISCRNRGTVDRGQTAKPPGRCPDKPPTRDDMGRGSLGQWEPVHVCHPGL